MPIDTSWLAEQRMREAIARGALDGLPGAGEPLAPDPLEGLTGEALREALLLRTLGAVPPEVLAMRDVAELLEAARQAPPAERADALARFQAAQTHLIILLERTGRGYLARQVGSLAV